MKLVKNFLKKFGGPILWGRKSYSQEGEDLIVERMVSKRSGFYVDVGCHHPFRFSNTYLFYKKGWSGINIDANPKSMKLFNRRRSRDINLEVRIAKKNGLLTYYQFNEPALNTFNEQEAQLKNAQPYHIVKTVQVPVKKLGDILQEYLPPSWPFHISQKIQPLLCNNHI